MEGVGRVMGHVMSGLGWLDANQWSGSGLPGGNDRPGQAEFTVPGAWAGQVRIAAQLSNLFKLELAVK